MPEATARHDILEAAVARLAEASDLPAFANQVEELLAVTQDEQASLWQLTEVILKNVSLTTKILRTVNSVAYNRSGARILSVSQAVRLMGVNAVRHLATSILLFDHFKARGSGVGEMLLLSLLTASHARHLAAESAYPRIEEAYLCGMFRNLGELLVCAYMPAEYAVIRADMKQTGDDARTVALRVLQFSYEELGQAMARRWKLGDEVASTMRRAETFGSTAGTESERLALLTAFSHELSACVYRVEPDQSRDRVASLVRRWGPALGVTETKLGDILGAGLAETKATFAAAHMPVDGLRLARQIDGVVATLGTPGGVSTAAGAAAPPADTFRSLAKEVGAVLDSDEPLTTNDIFMVIVEAIYRGGGFDRVLLCLLDQPRGQIVGRLGVGDGADDLVGRFRFSVSLLSGPIGPAILKKQDVLIDDVATSRFRESSFQAVVAASAFGLCPVAINGRVIGCFYFDRRSGPLGLDSAGREAILGLRDRAGRALEKLRRK